jgi:hypothetical protein
LIMRYDDVRFSEDQRDMFPFAIYGTLERIHPTLCIYVFIVPHDRKDSVVPMNSG